MRLFFAMAFPKGIIELVDSLYQQGVNEAVICPGSRNAPLMIALTRHGGFKCYSIADERSAGFFGLGIALKTGRPVVICCTSGSAGLNFAPVVVEAFFQEVPLIVLTADRPKEWIGQWDGQTIYQENLFGKHAKAFFDFETDDCTSAPLTAMAEPKGPVQINVPISEPFYPEPGFILENSSAIFQNENLAKCKVQSSKIDFSYFNQSIASAEKILVTVGQMEDNSIFETLSAYGIPVIGDATSNCGSTIGHDLLLADESVWPALQPDLHIHFGKSFVSKRIKQFLRTHKPKQSWLIHPNPIGRPDPFLCLTDVVNTDSNSFMEGAEWSSKTWNSWNSAKIDSKQTEFFANPSWTELHLYNQVTEAIEQKEAEVHIANSLAVRYINWTLAKFIKTEVYSNRGTSGIDGCLSTAVGAAQKTDKLCISIIGDVAFQYDRNALWNHYIPANLRIIVFNNGGGGIFRNLDGAKDLPELDEFMETRQGFTAENTAKDAGINYFSASNPSELDLNAFLHNQGPALLEIHTNSIENAAELKKYMALFKA
ncbi:2-succinyl-5-enolpyruvyl-6-hydroxy-3-cyclohexene-1-carboxylic-acid synthase [Pseudarcicella sp. GAP-15]|nr:2-succinyl-5-enolpyruvyl-6-hydroxy-3-cyclohexene-1-carboxylic-acid synthase [Pseudarcicella sp. GAP-15]